MSTSGETADLMVRESIQITESAVKLAALGAKNLAALLLALANDNQKIAGKTTLRKLLQSGDEIALFSINEKDLKNPVMTGISGNVFNYITKGVKAIGHIIFTQIKSK